MELQQLDHLLNWHPCAQMKDYESFKPIVVRKTYDSYIELADGRTVIDAISSWWCKSLGHNHPVLKQALLSQLEQFEHVLFAHTTHEVIVTLAQKLTTLCDGLDKVFYASDGSSAVEIALKMSLHSRMIQQQPHRKKFVALTNGYHGDTVGAMSVSDVGRFRDPYQALLFDPIFITPPYVCSTEDPIWHDASDAWAIAEKKLTPLADTITAIIFEPLLQGATGMKLYSADFLRRMAAWAKAQDIHLIADEIMTGIGRTGKMLACDHADIHPDFICLSKGLTSGFLPFSVVLTRNRIYDLFYDDSEISKAFLHSHTYSGNALGASVALATLQVIEKQKLCQRAVELQTVLCRFMQEIADETEVLQNVRALGAMVAADFSPSWMTPKTMKQFYKNAVGLGALLRPIGNTVYWLPPLTIQHSTLEELKTITLLSIRSIL